MRDYLFSTPYFFRIIKISMLLLIAFLILLAWIFPAPLQEPAQEIRVPNPVKAAWFLLWIQELVSYSKQLIYFVLLMGISFLFLPFLYSKEAERAKWLPGDQVLVNLAAIAAIVIIVVLTLVPWLCRGANWSFVCFI